jgi:hypothetical protein
MKGCRKRMNKGAKNHGKKRVKSREKGKDEKEKE